MVEKKENLEKELFNRKIAAFVIGITFMLSLLFLSGGITGNAVYNLSFKTTNFIGAGIFILGFIAWFLLRRK